MLDAGRKSADSCYLVPMSTGKGLAIGGAALLGISGIGAIATIPKAAKASAKLGAISAASYGGYADSAAMLRALEAYKSGRGVPSRLDDLPTYLPEPNLKPKTFSFLGEPEQLDEVQTHPADPTAEPEPLDWGKVKDVVDGAQLPQDLADACQPDYGVCAEQDSSETVDHELLELLGELERGPR